MLVAASLFTRLFHVKAVEFRQFDSQEIHVDRHTLQIDLHYQSGKTANRSSTTENRSVAIRVVEIVPVRVVEIVPVRVLRLTVVEMVPVFVVEMVPLLVVEMVPVFPNVVADRAVTNSAAQTNDLRFFIFFCS
jgi:hypothetical protein